MFANLTKERVLTMFIKEKATRSAVCIVMVAILACSLFVSAFAADAYQLGDVDRDGDIKMSDVVALQKAIAQLTQLDDEQKVLGDVTGDGQLKMDDVVAIQKYIAKLIPGFGQLSSDTDTPVNTDSDAPVNTDTDTPGNTDTDTPGNTDTDTPGNTDTDTPGNTDTDTPGNTDTDTPVDSDTDTDTESDDEDDWTKYVYKP